MDRKRLLVLSDTHGNVRALEAVLRWVKDLPQPDRVDAAVFLGDGATDLSRAESAAGFSCEWKIVRGNGDHDLSLPLSDVLDFGGRRFFLCHGHRYALNDGYYSLLAAAGNLKAEAALFGHTHIPCCNNDDDILLINPGSVGRPRSRVGATFAVIECEVRKPLEVGFWRISEHGKIKKLTIQNY